MLTDDDQMFLSALDANGLPAGGAGSPDPSPGSPDPNSGFDPNDMLSPIYSLPAVALPPNAQPIDLPSITPGMDTFPATNPAATYSTAGVSAPTNAPSALSSQFDNSDLGMGQPPVSASFDFGSPLIGMGLGPSTNPYGFPTSLEQVAPTNNAYGGGNAQPMDAGGSALSQDEHVSPTAFFHRNPNRYHGPAATPGSLPNAPTPANTMNQLYGPSLFGHPAQNPTPPPLAGHALPQPWHPLTNFSSPLIPPTTISSQMNQPAQSAQILRRMETQNAAHGLPPLNRAQPSWGMPSMGPKTDLGAANNLVGAMNTAIQRGEDYMTNRSNFGGSDFVPTLAGIPFGFANIAQNQGTLVAAQAEYGKYLANQLFGQPTAAAQHRANSGQLFNTWTGNIGNFKDGFLQGITTGTYAPEHPSNSFLPEMFDYAKNNPTSTFLNVAGLTTLLADGAAFTPRVTPPLVHLTDEAGASGIAETGKIGGKWGIFALNGDQLPSSNLGRQAATLQRGDLSHAVPIPDSAASLFQQPSLTGPFSLYQRAQGVYQSPLGSIDMNTGQFMPNVILKDGTFQTATPSDVLWYNLHNGFLKVPDALINTGILGYGQMEHYLNQNGGPLPPNLPPIIQNPPPNTKKSVGHT